MKQNEDWSNSQSANEFNTFVDAVRDACTASNCKIENIDNTTMPMTFDLINENNATIKIEWFSQHLDAPKTVIAKYFDAGVGEHKEVFDKTYLPGTFKAALKTANDLVFTVNKFEKSEPTDECLKDTRFKEVIDKDVLDLFDEIDKTIANESRKNEAGKCTWQAWQEGKKYSCPDETYYGDLMDYDKDEQTVIIKAGFTDPDQINVMFPANAVFTVKSMHGPGGGNPVIVFDAIPDMEFDVFCEDYDDTLYSIVESKKNERNMSYCRFYNTLDDLQDCYNALANGDISSKEEFEKAKRLIEVCKSIASDYEDYELDPADFGLDDEYENECLKDTRFKEVIDKDVLDLFDEIDKTIANE